MAGVGRPTALLELTDDERATLTRWARRANIVLASAEGLMNKDVAARLGVAAHTVAKWRARFVAERLDGLTDEPRPGRPR